MITPNISNIGYIFPSAYSWPICSSATCLFFLWLNVSSVCTQLLPDSYCNTSWRKQKNTSLVIATHSEQQSKPSLQSAWEAGDLKSSALGEGQGYAGIVGKAAGEVTAFLIARKSILEIRVASLFFGFKWTKVVPLGMLYAFSFSFKTDMFEHCYEPALCRGTKMNRHCYLKSSSSQLW